VEEQLGLRPETQERPMPVMAIERLKEKPAGN
jgi:hypothetical protein